MGIEQSKGYRKEKKILEYKDLQNTFKKLHNIASDVIIRSRISKFELNSNCQGVVYKPRQRSDGTIIYDDRKDITASIIPKHLFEKNFTPLEVNYIYNAISNRKHVYMIDAREIPQLDITDIKKKEAMCKAIGNYYSRIRELFVLITTTIIPYTDDKYNYFY